MLNARLHEALSISHFETTIFYTVNLIVNDLFMINFVYTLCNSTPGQIQYGQFITALARKIGDQVRILYLLFLWTKAMFSCVFDCTAVLQNCIVVNFLPLVICF